MSDDKAREAGRIDCGGKNESGKDVDVEEEAGDKGGDGGDASEEGANFGDGESFEDPEIEQVGKEHVPLENGDDAHGDEGVDDKEEVVIDLEPVWRRADGDRMILSKLDHRMIDGP